MPTEIDRERVEEIISRRFEDPERGTAWHKAYIDAAIDVVTRLAPEIRAGALEEAAQGLPRELQKCVYADREPEPCNCWANAAGWLLARARKEREGRDDSTSE